MLHRPLLSIIIPVYNVAKYIEACLLSILQQSSNNPDIEIIIVDDGSPDDSIIIAEKIIANSRNVKVLRQQNQGLSMARNNGMSISTGKYIWFIDSDDTINPNTISGIISCLCKDPDLLQINCQYVFTDNRPAEIPSISCNWNGYITGKSAIAQGGLPAPAPFTIYRRKLLEDNSIRFIPSLLHEDSEFKPRITYFANRIACFKPIVYNYLQRNSGSIMSSYSLKNFQDLLIVIKNLHEFKNLVVKENQCKKGFCKIIGLNVNSLLYGFRQLDNHSRVIAFKLFEKNKYIFKEVVKSGCPKYYVKILR